MKLPKKNCFRCDDIENIGKTKDIWKCNKGIFDKLGEKGVDFLVCPFFILDKGIKEE